MKAAISHWKTTSAAIAAVLMIAAKWPNVDQHDIETALLALGIFFAADARGSQTNG